VIPYAHALQIFEAAQEPKQLVTVLGGGHIEAFTERFGGEDRDLVSRFLEGAPSRSRTEGEAPAP